jgi:phosphomethylpyrimidine synthase
MKISEEVRQYAKEKGLEANDNAILDGMKQKAEEFNASGGEIYQS